MKTILFISSAIAARKAAGNTSINLNFTFGSHHKQIKKTKKVNKGGISNVNLLQIVGSLSGESGKVIVINSLRKLNPVVRINEIKSNDDAKKIKVKSIALS
tara:strand:+ start:496 stop:798 length:303 start_codon:yes stop_codon:yes gene_type:complete